jgi:glutathione S-transferase
MKLFDCRTAPSPRRVRIFVAEKNLDLELVPVDLGSGEQFSAEFRAINPDCVVPVLELDDGTHVTEVVAICQYLEESKPEPTLFGSSAAERAIAMMWNAKAEQQGLWAMADAFRNVAKGLKGHALPGPDEYEQIPALAERGRSRVLAFFGKMNDQLAQQEFLAGKQFTIADITALVLADFAARAKIGFADDAVHLQRWYASVAARPSASA